jgi:sortase A
MYPIRYIKKNPNHAHLPLFPFISMFIGGFILSWVVWPILAFEIDAAGYANNMVSPLSDIWFSTNEKQSLDNSYVSQLLPENQPIMIDSTVKEYTLSIPKLGIANASVKVGGTDLKHHLIHFGGTQIPGKNGTGVIFGHSVLPQFFDPKNYLTIFSLLPTLKEGDDIYVSVDGITYRYKVATKKIVSPDDISGLEQRNDNAYLTLVTCVPPGTYLKRLWLTAKLINYAKPKI